MGFIVIGIIAFLAGAFIIFIRKERVSGCVPYIAKVINVEEKMAVTGPTVKKMYRPVVSYKGSTSEQRARYHTYISFYNFDLKMGDELTAFIDPRMPDVFYFSSDVRGVISLGAVLGFAVGALFVAAGIIVLNGGLQL